MYNKILIVAGPSGGHLFPAQAYAEAWREKFPSDELLLVTSEKGKALTGKIPPGIFNQSLYLPEFPAPRGISLRTIPFLLQLTAGFLQAFQILKKIKPDLVVGFGSYVTFPVIVLAHLNKVPTLIHEQNVVAGWATRMLIKHADKIAVSFPLDRNQKQMGSDPEGSDPFWVTGLPLRRKMKDFVGDLPKKSQDLFKILIVGGSQGALGLNKKVLEAFSFFSSEEKEKIAVTHVAGEKDFERVGQFYQELGIPAQVYPFSDHMKEHYLEADMAITRAGANTLFELALFKVPAVVIPYPYAGAHQAQNGNYFANRGACLCVEEKDLDGHKLSEVMRDWMTNPKTRESFRDKLSELASPDAAEKLVELSLLSLQAKDSVIPAKAGIHCMKNGSPLSRG